MKESWIRFCIQPIYTVQYIKEYWRFSLCLFLFRKNEENFTLNVDVSRPEKDCTLEYLEIKCLCLIFLVADTMAMSEIVKKDFYSIMCMHLRKKWSSSLRNFSVNMIKSPRNWGFGLLLKNPWNLHYFCAVNVYSNANNGFQHKHFQGSFS